MERAAALRDLERRTDQALGSLEHENRWAEALEIYRRAGADLEALGIAKGDPGYRDARRLRAYLYLREANALRALGRPAEAAPLGTLELDAAMASGDSLSIARAMFSLGGTCLANGEVERGLKFLDDSKAMFEHHDDPEHRQGLGWWYILQADLANAGLVDRPPQAALAAGDTALAILRPLTNWPGVARAHAARARAYERLGDAEAARVEHAARQMAEAMLSLQDEAVKSAAA